MRVRMKATLSGTRDGVDWPKPGGCVDLPEDEAAHLVAAGLALADEPGEETATPADTTEKAVHGRRRTQGKKPMTKE